MCDLTMALGAASLAFGAMGAYQQSASAKASMEYQSQVAQNNAITAEYQAQDAVKRGEVAEAEQRRRTSMMKGSQTARLAANGLDISEGSALNILSDTDWMGEQDALTVRDNASREAWGYRQQGANSQSNSDMLSASADAQNPFLSGVSSIMTNESTGLLAESIMTKPGGLVADKWYKMSESKPSSFSFNNSAGTSTSMFEA
jgi:hypothetical protein